MKSMIEIIEGRPEDAKAVVEFTKKVGGETDNLTFALRDWKSLRNRKQCFFGR